MASLTIPLPWQLQQWQGLQARRQQGRLMHALLLTGAAGVGKSLFAAAFADSCLCLQPDAHGHACGQCKSCHLMQAKTHPDYYTIAPEGDSQTIKVDQIRQLSEKLSCTAQQGHCQVVLITPAEAMNAAAANALLKTLEEPNGEVKLLLLSQQSHRLPSTIVSRCQTVFFPSPSLAEIRTWLAADVPESCDIELLLAFHADAPLTALNALQEKEAMVAIQQFIDELAAFMANKQELTRLALAWSKLPLIHTLDRMTKCLVALIQALIVGQSGVLSQRLLPLCRPVLNDALFSLLDRLYKNRQLLYNKHPLNAQLFCENLLYHWQLTLVRGSV